MIWMPRGRSRKCHGPCGGKLSTARIWAPGLGRRGCKPAIFCYAYRPIKVGGLKDRPYNLPIGVE